MWFYRGLGGLGGWALLAGGGLSAAVWVFANSRRRALPARFERTKIAAAQLFSVPAAILHFTSVPMIVWDTAADAYDVAFYMGMLGGLAPAWIALWYAFRYRGKVACRNGHPPYAGSLHRCPRCAGEDMITAHGQAVPSASDDPHIIVNAQWQHAQASRGWLVSRHGRRYALFKGETTLGRGHDMALQFVGDQVVSRRHTRIVERDGRFFIMDLGSTYGTRVNNRFLSPHVEEELKPGDVIELSDVTHLAFGVR
jgi:hypothetical protein